MGDKIKKTLYLCFNSDRVHLCEGQVPLVTRTFFNNGHDWTREEAVSLIHSDAFKIINEYNEKGYEVVIGKEEQK